MSNASLQFRIATQDDAARIQDLIQSSFRTEDPRPKWTGSAELASEFHISVDEVLASMNKPECAVIVATDPTDTTIVASVECAMRRSSAAADSNNNNDMARIAMLAVDDNRQRSGLGRAVLARAEDYCRKEWGVTRLGLNALSTREELISWYVRCGFERTGETSSFPRERFPGRSLREDLCFVELEKNLVSVG